MNDLIVSRLALTLKGVQGSVGERFSGVGIIVCDAPERIPLFPIRQFGSLAHVDTEQVLAQISTPTSEFHDGFHVLSSQWELTRVAQYFSPPIIQTSNIDRSKRFGGRYLAALFGSALLGVDATGIASKEFGIAVFAGGEEVLYEQAQ